MKTSFVLPVASQCSLQLEKACFKMSLMKTDYWQAFQTLMVCLLGRFIQYWLQGVVITWQLLYWKGVSVDGMTWRHQWSEVTELEGFWSERQHSIGMAQVQMKVWQRYSFVEMWLWYIGELSVRLYYQHCLPHHQSHLSSCFHQTVCPFLVVLFVV